MTTTTSLPAPAVAFGEDGYLLHAGQWTPELAHRLAAQEDIELTDAHFALLHYLREQYAKGVALTIRRVGRSGMVDVKGFYALFPGGPLKKAARIAGIPKPKSCI